MRFTALEDFFAEETQSQYVHGLSYTVESKLIDLAPKWIREGKIEWGAPESRVTGG